MVLRSISTITTLLEDVIQDVLNAEKNGKEAQKIINSEDFKNLVIWSSLIHFPKST